MHSDDPTKPGTALGKVPILQCVYGKKNQDNVQFIKCLLQESKTLSEQFERPEQPDWPVNFFSRF